MRSNELERLCQSGDPVLTARHHSTSQSSHLSESDKKEVRIESSSQDDYSSQDFEGVTEEVEPSSEDKNVSPSPDVFVAALFNSLIASLKKVS